MSANADQSSLRCETWGWRLAGVLLWVLAGVSVAGAQSLTVAAASDLQAVMPVLSAAFEKATGEPIRVTYGSSGNFFSQIQNGAPFDVFMSADAVYPRQLEASGLTVPDSLVVYGVGRIVLWAHRRSPAHVGRGLEGLNTQAVKRIAIANPNHAPYGRAAVSALQHVGLYDRLKSRLILGENVSQAAMFADSGNADAGIIALSLALSPALKQHGSFFLIPLDFYPPLEQAAVIVKSSRKQDAARAFLRFMRRPEIVRLMETAGFAPPKERGR